jgi:hypothetical protein
VKLDWKTPIRYHKVISTGALLFWALMSAASVFADDSVLLFGNKNTYGIGPRAMGMGGAFAAVADDASAVWWNPAGLVQIPAYTLSLSSAPIFKRRSRTETMVLLSARLIMNRFSW